jgi:RNA polymerase sigma-70 factor (ECF subfamily)
MHQADRSWIRAVLERHEGALVGYAARITGDAESARDVVQEAFIKLCAERREAVEPHLAEWLYTVCRRGAIDARRRKHDGTEVADMDRHASQDGALGALEVEEEGARALALLARLPAKQQEALRLRFQSGLSYKEIARVTEQSIGNVGWLIHVGLRSLRSQLEGGRALERRLS